MLETRPPDESFRCCLGQVRFEEEPRTDGKGSCMTSHRGFVI